MRIKYYAFVGDLALQPSDHAQQVRYTLDPDHLAALLQADPAQLERLPELRPSCVGAAPTAEGLAPRLDEEIRRCRQEDQRHMHAYATAMKPWAERFRAREPQQNDMPLLVAHHALCAEATDCLPLEVSW